MSATKYKEKQLTAAERYAEKLASRPLPTEILVLPDSGFEIEMEKLEVLGIVLGGELPQYLTNTAAEAWLEKGVIDPQAVEQTQAEQAETGADTNTKAMLKLRDKVVAESVNPKLVLGKPKAENELPLSMLSDNDLMFLLINRAGGDAGDGLAKFSFRPGQNVKSGTSRKQKRNPRK